MIGHPNRIPFLNIVVASLPVLTLSTPPVSAISALGASL
eukprot:COSAG03_NODE_21499_length_303_cov_0.985294_1_plen_38_part_10